ncbi:MAG: UDP-N-acetylmuramate--L-alanine ligase, partial [Clostridia bacterium]|nr:UDP-N-acetylmuramate--L-alanine ligase [Clostridia bacterium]
ADLDGISPDVIARGIAKFRGIGRRMEYKGKLGEAPVYDDYAHHPTELRATLEAARTIVGDGKLTAVFQPHTYSRTSALFSDFAEVLRLADRVLLPPIYPARETDDLGVSSKLLADAAGEKVLAFDSIDAIARELNSSATDGVVVIMGAGNIDSIYKMLNIK